MTRVYETVVCETSQLAFIQCNKCKIKIDSDDTFEFQEALRLSFTGGFGSIWGDGSHIDIDLCQSCSYELLSPYVTPENDE